MNQAVVIAGFTIPCEHPLARDSVPDRLLILLGIEILTSSAEAGLLKNTMH